MSNRLHLYQVLIQEYNSQETELRIPDEYIAEKLEELRGRFEEIADQKELQTKINDAMVTVFYNWLHEHKVRRTALSLSGGGIRSATFGLGVLQGLAHNNLLDKFCYLSTVSGGGYVGGWLSAWIHRHPQGLPGVSKELPSEDPPLLLNPEPEPVNHLRSYSNYLTPQLGLLSADTWTLVAIITRNVILNWLPPIYSIETVIV